MSRRRRATKNPIEQLRKPWNGDNLTEVVSWRAVQDTIHNEGRAFEGRRSLGRFIEVITDGTAGDAEVTVYITEIGRFEKIRPDEEYAIALEDPANVGENIEWTRENATRVIRGNVEHDESFCIRHRPTYGIEAEADLCTNRCERTYDGGWRGLLRSFLDQSDFWDNMSWRTPVIIDGAPPVILNEAALTEREKAVFDAISGEALQHKEYEETNEDAVSDIPEAAGATRLREALFRRHIVSWDAHGSREDAMREHGSFGPTAATESVRKWVDILYRLEHLVPEEGLTEEDTKRVQGRFERDLDYEIRHSFKAWSRRPTGERARTRGPSERNTARDLVFLTYEHDGGENQELSDDARDLIAELGSDALHPYGGQHVQAALARLDIEWELDGAPENYSIETHADWEFTIDVDDLAEALEELVREHLPEPD